MDGRRCTHLEFEVDGVFVPPEARREVAGENEWGFRPEMILTLLDRHGLLRERAEDWTDARAAVGVDAYDSSKTDADGPNADAVRNPTVIPTMSWLS